MEKNEAGGICGADVGVRGPPCIPFAKGKMLIQPRHVLRWRRLYEKQFIDVAPRPALARLERLNNRMPGGVIMCPCVPVLGGIATADVSATQAESQMHPGVAHPQTIFTAACAWRDVLNFIDMRTLSDHFILQPELCIA